MIKNLEEILNVFFNEDEGEDEEEKKEEVKSPLRPPEGMFKPSKILVPLL